MITKLTLPILLITSLFYVEALKGKNILNLNFGVVFLKAIKHAPSLTGSCTEPFNLYAGRLWGHLSIVY